MARDTRAQSISSNSSDGSSSGIEVEAASASTSRLPASRNLQGIGYRPPRGFDPIEFSEAGVLSEKSLASGKGREAWAFRIPAGVSPSQLDGLVIQLPPQDLSSHDVSKPLASLQAPTASSNTYNLYVSKPEQRKKSKKAASSESQLISMAAAGSLNPANPNKSNGLDGSADTAAGQGAAAELASLHLLVPAGDGRQPGRLVLGKYRYSLIYYATSGSSFSCYSPGQDLKVPAFVGCVASLCRDRFDQARS